MISVKYLWGDLTKLGQPFEFSNAFSKMFEKPPMTSHALYYNRHIGGVKEGGVDISSCSFFNVCYQDMR